MSRVSSSWELNRTPVWTDLVGIGTARDGDRRDAKGKGPNQNEMSVENAGSRDVIKVL
jgi:hypothetical protein